MPISNVRHSKVVRYENTLKLLEYKQFSDFIRNVKKKRFQSTLFAGYQYFIFINLAMHQKCGHEF